MTIKEQIRKEIERRTYNAHEVPDSRPDKQFYEGKDVAYGEILAFLDTLPEQPVIKKFNELFDRCVENCDPAVMKEVSDNVDKMLASEGLEEEISTWIPAHISGGDNGVWKDTKNAVTEWGGFVARHFAEWGEENAYKAIMKKADEVRDKRFDTDYEVKIEPAAGFDLGCVNVYHEGKLVGQYVEPREEKKLPEGLEEAAEEYANKHYSEWDESWDDYNGHNVEPENDKLELMDAFIAGAKWMSIHGNDIKEL